jgi:hypothetical protein
MNMPEILEKGEATMRYEKPNLSSTGSAMDLIQGGCNGRKDSSPADGQDTMMFCVHQETDD